MTSSAFSCLSFVSFILLNGSSASDQLGKSAQEAELGAAKNAARATRTMFAMCGVSLLLLLVLALSVIRSITAATPGRSQPLRTWLRASSVNGWRRRI